jgi:hypothetical protein
MSKRTRKSTNDSDIRLRPYTKAFSTAKVRRISALLAELKHLRASLPRYRIFIFEIRGCLSVGLLLAATQVSTAVLELFVRDLTVAHRIKSRHKANIELRGRVERESEEDRGLSFAKMLDELSVVISDHDVKALRGFYKETRIPLAHALVRRFTSLTPDDGLLDDVFSSLAPGSGLENRIEDEDGALKHIEFVVQMFKKYGSLTAESGG